MFNRLNFHFLLWFPKTCSTGLGSAEHGHVAFAGANAHCVRLVCAVVLGLGLALSCFLLLVCLLFVTFVHLVFLALCLSAPSTLCLARANLTILLLFLRLFEKKLVIPGQDLL